MTIEQTYFRKGFGLKAEVQPVIDAEYHSALVQQIQAAEYTQTFGDVTVRLAEEFGFCYGVDRAIDYAYETTKRFPDKTLYLVGEIIHNPHVNQRLRDMGIQFLYPDDKGDFDFSHITADEVVIMPAFGVKLTDFQRLSEIGCVLVDTTCGSVLLVWKRVESYARDGFAAVIHGKYKHEESRATASQTAKHPGGSYIMVRGMEETDILCDYIAKRPGHLSREEFIERFADKTSEGFDPDVHLQRIGVANQTTMLANESLAIGERIRQTMVEALGEEHTSEHFRSFGTICSATQERQDAVVTMMEASRPDIMIVIGGYNSSNTNHLAHMCRDYTTTYHIEDADCIDVDAGTIRHKPDLTDPAERIDTDWLRDGPLELGITAGASTPNNKIGDVVLRVLTIRGMDPGTVLDRGEA